ncbi:hypothetical protein EZ313_20210 [Ramlibacter henchirensis]|uniref:Uncharacterized protein n=1 Tax=Ramlibacter henchirensis TaxID=204072 RepID=A0A4Z0BPS6_9BURK|nr:DUF6139 family protein [Ramlibacter henchirensis]TFZ00772.1 hypothetical protein EZ313_20210 [Ramlibacter henchirensis]
MKVDIYRRPEPQHKLSFIAVPAGQEIPQEAINVDWHVVANNVEIDVEAPQLPDYGIDEAAKQIREKGYAITSVYHQVAAGG